MSVVLQPSAPVIFDLKSAALTLIAVVLKTTDLDALRRELDERLSQAPHLFDQELVAVDLSQVRDEAAPIDFDALLALMREHKMVPIAAKGGSAAQMQAAFAAGLVEAPQSAPAVAPPRAAASLPEVVLTEVMREVPVATPSTLVIDKPLRSGQQIYAKGGDLVVLAIVSFGAEVIADGNIHVYAPLRGRAIAGARGNTDARIFTTCMEPQLVSIAGIYRTTETELPPEVLGKPAQVRLHDERLVVEALKL